MRPYIAVSVAGILILSVLVALAIIVHALRSAVTKKDSKRVTAAIVIATTSVLLPILTVWWEVCALRYVTGSRVTTGAIGHPAHDGVNTTLTADASSHLLWAFALPFASAVVASVLLCAVALRSELLRDAGLRRALWSGLWIFFATLVTGTALLFADAVNVFV